MKKYLISISVLFVLLLPAFSTLSAQTTNPPNVVTTQLGAVTVCVDLNNGNQQVPCNSFDQLMTAVKNVINYAVTLALSFSVVVIAYAGWLYLTSGDSATKRSQANGMFVKVAWGIGWVLGAWLVVNLIMTALVNSNIPNFIKN